MTGWCAADLDQVGRTHTIRLACTCGATHCLTTTAIRNPAIPSLATNIVQNLDEWRGQREWCRHHRPHGGITQEKS